MPPRNPTAIQLDFPELTADLISQLRLTGTIGLLDFVPTVLPVFIIGDRDLQIEANPPTYQPAEVFSASSNVLGAGAVILDTGQLAAGVHDISWGLSITALTALTNVSLQHRNAANTATLAEWHHQCLTTATEGDQFSSPPIFGINIGLNERLRWVNSVVQASASRAVSVWMIAARRPIP